MFTRLAIALKRRSIRIHLVLIANCGIALLAHPSDASTLSWAGYYRNEEDVYQMSPIRAINLRQLGANKFKAELEYNPNHGETTALRKTVRIVGNGSVYKNADAHDFKDAMVIFFPAAHFQPIVILKSGPISKQQEQGVLHFDFLEYTLFENSEFGSGYAGKLLHRAKKQQ